MLKTCSMCVCSMNSFAVNAWVIIDKSTHVWWHIQTKTAERVACVGANIHKVTLMFPLLHLLMLVLLLTLLTIKQITREKCVRNCAGVDPQPSVLQYIWYFWSPCCGYCSRCWSCCFHSVFCSTCWEYLAEPMLCIILAAAGEGKRKAAEAQAGAKGTASKLAPHWKQRGTMST